MFSFSIDQYIVSVDSELPDIYNLYKVKADYVFERDFYSTNENLAFFSVERIGEGWPFAIICIRYDRHGSTRTGVSFIPETKKLFLGVGTILYIFDIENPELIMEESAEMGFWSLDRHNDIVLMSAELKLSAWNLEGKQLWSSHVEPPWHFSIEGNNLELDVMGNITKFEIAKGPEK